MRGSNLSRVLLIEPNRSVAGLIKTFLEDNFKDVEVQTASGAQEAITAADELKPNAVILELALPGQNGFAFLHEFRSYPDWQSVPVIVHSHLAKEEASMSKSWESLGAEYFFYKPNTTLKSLSSAVRDVLDR